MFLLAGKIVHDTFASTMANAGSSAPMPMAYPPQRTFPARNIPIESGLIDKGRIEYPKQPIRKYSISNMHLESEPIFITCPHCFELITTKVIYEENNEVPRNCCSRLFGINSRKNCLHYCPKDGCHAYLGKFVP